MNDSDTLKSIRRYTIGQTVLQAGMFSEIAGLGAQLKELQRTAECQSERNGTKITGSVVQNAWEESAEESS